MSGVAWFDRLTAVAFAALAVVSLARLVTRRRDRAGRADAAAHGTMAAGMAAMALPALDPVPAAAWIAVFVVVGAWAVAALARSPEGRGPAVRGPGPPPAGAVSGRRLARVAAAHHAAASALMIVLLAAGHPAHAYDHPPASASGPDSPARALAQPASGEPGDTAGTPGGDRHAGHHHHAEHTEPTPTDGESAGAGDTDSHAGSRAEPAPTPGGGPARPAGTAGALSVPGPLVAMAGLGFLGYAGWLALGLVGSAPLAATGCACAVRARRLDAACAAAMSAGMALMALTMA